VVLQALVILKESDYFKVRVPNAILPQKKTLSKTVQVSPTFDVKYSDNILTIIHSKTALRAAAAQ